ncbi:Bug family tripartite tricarboxylate transporter substrate binding protein [Roseomonas populi]|uniref:Tripartite tricarboxylate transporter substrate binding protein n=1 Tax=Roseomonas populi TaxID=3121582 RepID=A0ABT1XBY6_9PROT|nr:tripartite tricarboxylate transporter substrate binding protein [Roseomonas pecuniae]MCR0984918.1 tripartite tricarboxylate transporter substrate binding protein [Roseomonas pecuniae]
MRRRALLAAPVLAFAARAARAQSWPARPVRVIIPFPPGGGIDILVRAVGAELSSRWGQPVVVESRAGASGIIGAEAAARSAPDGYTLLGTVNQTFTTNRFLFRTLPYDPDKGFTPVSLMVQSDHMLLAHPSVEADDVAGLIRLAKGKPGSLTYGSFGSGTQPQLVYEAMNQHEKLDILHVPYNGIAPLMLATTRGEVMLATGSASVAGELIRTGKIKALGTAGSRRIGQFPQVPTTGEQGFPYIRASIWYGLFAPAGTPDEVVQRIGNDVREVLNTPAFTQAQVTNRGLDLVASDGPALAREIRDETASVGEIIRAARIEPQ